MRRIATFFGRFRIASPYVNLRLSCLMAREQVILECSEARKEGKPPSRYMTTRNKKTQTEPVEKKKYNKFLGRHTVHKEVKS